MQKKVFKTTLSRATNTSDIERQLRKILSEQLGVNGSLFLTNANATITCGHMEVLVRATRKPPYDWAILVTTNLNYALLYGIFMEDDKCDDD